MNRTFKVIFNQVLGRHVVVSEIASSIQRGARKAVMAVAAGGALAAAALLPMGEAGAISSSYVPSYNSQYGSSGPADYQTDGGHVDVNQIGGYNQQAGSYYNYVYVNDDGTINFYKNENYQQNDISSMVGNVAIGNFSQAGSAADAKMVGFYNSSMSLAYETKPEGATGTWYQTSAPDGKLYWYQSSWNNRTYAYSPTYNYGGTFLEKDGKYYHGSWSPDLDDQGNYQYDEQGNTIGSYKFAEVGEKIWKQNPDNPSGNLLVDYKKVDEYGQPVFDLTAEEIGLDESNPYGYSGGTNNVAVGNKAKTVSHSSVAVGDTSTARGYRSIAIGAQSEAGSENSAGDWDSGVSAVAIGDSAKAYGGTSVAVGSHAQTWSFSGIAVGNGSNAGTEYGIAIGDGANVAYINGAGDIEQQRTAAQSIAIGRNALAQAKDVTAVGRNAQGMMRNATAYGNNAHANGWNSIAIGNKATAGLQAEIVNEDGTAKDGTIANSAIAIGNRARAEAEYTTAIGAGTNAKGWHAVAVGDSNQATGMFSTAIGAGWSINHTEGEPDSDDAQDGSDAINTEGKRTYESIGANQAGGDYSTAAGYGNKTVGTQSSAFGKENEISGLSSLGAGAGNKVGTVAVGDDGILLSAEDQENTVSGYAVGSYNTITGSEGTNAGAFGANNTVAGDNGYAVGNSNNVAETSSQGLAFGNSNTVEGEQGIVIGTNNTVTGSGGNGNNDNTTSSNDGTTGADAGNGSSGGSTATGIQSIAIGSGNTVQGDKSIAIGDGHTVTGDNNAVIGDPNTVEGNDNQVLANNSTVTGDRNIAIGNEVEVTADDAVAIGTKAKATADGGVALGSDSEAGRAADAKAGGYNIATDEKEYTDGTSTWQATHAAVSVGTDDGSVTRQITGVAAGTEDTDAVNVAQLKLAKTEVKAGNNVTVDKTEDATDGHPIYTVNGLKTVVKSEDGSVTVTGGEPDAYGIITYDLSVTAAGGATYEGSQSVTEGGAGEGSTTFTLTDVDHKQDVGSMTVEAGDNITISSKTDEYGNVVGAVISAVDTDTHNGLKNDENTVTYNDDGEGSVTITDQDGNTTTINGIKDTDTHNGLKNDENTVTYNDDGEGSVTITDQDGNTTTINGIKDTDTQYKLSGESGEKAEDGSTTYTVTLKDKAGNDAGSAQIIDTDTHNGLKNDENSVTYNDDGEGSVTITDQDGNTTTINGIKNSGGGQKYGGDTGDVIAKKANEQVNVVGGIGDESKLTTEDNIGVVSDGKDNLKVRLAKDVKGVDTVQVNNSVTVGKGGDTTTINNEGVKVSNGPTITRTNVDMNNQQIHNVAAGTADTDAVNVSQLRDMSANYDQKINHLNHRIGEVAQDANAGVAMALAAASLPQVYLPGKSMMAVAGGTYRGESGYAIGFSTISDDGKWIIKAHASGNSQGHYGAGIGAGYMW